MEITGYRCWDVEIGGTLLAPIIGARWRPGPNTARCKAIAHAEPLASCSCGYYALHEPVAPAAGQLAGVISGWGDIGVQPDGWRAEHAQIVALAIPPRALVLTRRGLVDSRTLAKRAAAKYGVPLVDAAQLGVLASEHGEVVPEQIRPARASRTYEQIASLVRAIPPARRLLLSVERYGYLAFLAAAAWMIGSAAALSGRALQRWSGPSLPSVLAASAVVLACAGIGRIRRANGRWSAGPLGSLTFIRLLLACGLLVPWLAADLNAPKRVSYAAALFAGFFAFEVLLAAPAVRTPFRLSVRSIAKIGRLTGSGNDPAGSPRAGRTLLIGVAVALAALVPIGAIVYGAIEVVVVTVGTLGWWLVPTMCAAALLTRPIRLRAFKPFGGQR